MTPEDTPGTPWMELVAGASVVYQQALDALDVPVLVLELPSRHIRAANQAVADLFASPVAEMIGRRTAEVVTIEDEKNVNRALAAISSGAIDAYRARRRLTARDGALREAYVWCRAVDVDGHRLAAFILSPLSTEGEEPQRIRPPIGWTGPVVIGRADADGVVRCISSDVRDVLGLDPAMGKHWSLVTQMQPDDAAAVMQAVRHSPVGGMTLRDVRIRHADGRWVQLQGLFVRLDGTSTPKVAFSLLPDQQLVGESRDRLIQLEVSLRRIAAELEAAGFLDGIEHLPTAEEFPAINTLSSRQWQILIRLLRGERVPTIARELHLSHGTVRNQLSAIFERFRVHSQSELLALLRRR